MKKCSFGQKKIFLTFFPHFSSEFGLFWPLIVKLKFLLAVKEIYEIGCSQNREKKVLL